MSEQHSSLPPLPERGPLKARLRQWFRDLLRYSRPREPPPPRGNHLDRAVYGAAQPLLGLRLVFSSWSLFREAIEPVLWLAFVCSVYAFFKHTEPDAESIFPHSLAWARAVAFYTAFAALAPLPSVIFANHYARFAARVRMGLGFGVCGPREMPIVKSLRRLAQQSILVAITFVPFVALAHLFPGHFRKWAIGELIGQAVIALWALNWVVLEAFDDANVLQPGQTLRDVELESEHLRRPWFVRMFRWLEDHAPERPRALKKVLRKFGNFVDKLSKPWREESALLEASPKLGLGFALSTATLLAIPGLNLLFRPVIIAGATHLLGHIEQDQHAESPEVLHEHAPPDARNDEPSLGDRFPLLGKRFED
jgi:hypothetical protein